MSRKLTVVGVVTAAVFIAGSLAACSGSSPGEAGADTDSPAAAPTTQPPYRVAGYPTPRDADVAFVSEVAPLEGVFSWLSRDPYILPTNLTEDAARLAELGRWACGAYHGGNVESVGAELQSAIWLDAIDASAFLVTAAGVYCPEELVDLGGGQAMRGGVVVEPVTPLCPTEPPVTVRSVPIELSGYSNIEEYGDLGEDNELVYGDTDGLYDGTWTYTLTNTSGYGAIVTLEERVLSPRYDTEWRAPGGSISVQPHRAFYVPAGQSVSDTGQISGVYAWQTAEYRIVSWLPVDCGVELGT